MDRFFDLPQAERVGFLLMTGAFILFVVFIVVAALLILRPSKVGPGGWLVFGGGKKKEADASPKGSILHHRLFKFFDKALMPGALSLDGNSDKSIICENFLRVKFEVLKLGFEDFFEQLERDRFDGLSKLPGFVNEMIMDYEMRASLATHHLSKGTICRLPQSFIRKFSKWHQRHSDQLFDDYADILADRGIRDNRERSMLMAEATYFALRETINDAKLTLGDLNGDLDSELSVMVEEAAELCED